MDKFLNAEGTKEFVETISIRESNKSQKCEKTDSQIVVKESNLGQNCPKIDIQIVINIQKYVSVNVAFDDKVHIYTAQTVFVGNIAFYYVA